MPTEFFQNPQSLVNREGYVIHVNTKENASGPDTIIEYLPIRQVTIKQCKQFGEFMWIDFELGDWVRYEQKGPTGLNEHHQQLLKSAPNQNSEGLTRTLYEAQGLVLPTVADQHSAIPSEANVNWIRIVKHMARFDDHQKLKPDYLKLISIDERDRSNPVLPQAVLNTEKGYKFKSDVDYRMEVLQFSPHYSDYPAQNFAKTSRLELSLDKDRVDPLIGEARIWGKYDSLILSFRPLPTLRSFGTVVKINVNRGIETTGSEMTKEGEDGAAKLEEGKNMDLSVTIYAQVVKGWKQVFGALAVALGVGLASAVQFIPGGIFWAPFVAAVLAFVGIYWGGLRG